MDNDRNPWKTFGLITIAVATVGVVGTVGYLIGTSSDDTSLTTPAPAVTQPVADTTATSDQSAATEAPQDTATPATEPPSTEVEVTPTTLVAYFDDWRHDLLAHWRANEPSIAAAWYNGPIPWETAAQSYDVITVRYDLNRTSRILCNRFAEEGSRYANFTWTEGEAGTLDRILTADERTHMFIDILDASCPENR